MNAIQCFYVCLSTAGLLVPIVLLTVVTVLLFVAFYMDRGFRPLLGAQLALTVAISVSLLSMECYMAWWVWAYLGLVLSLALLVAVVRAFNASRLERSAIGRSPTLSDLEDEFDVQIVVLDTQRVRAVAYRDRIYLSVGLLERLDDEQLRAVVAHEAYHLSSSPPRLLSFLLAITSLTFVRFNDEGSADAYAARITSVDAVISALTNLGIDGREGRTLELRQNH